MLKEEQRESKLIYFLDGIVWDLCLKKVGL